MSRKRLTKLGLILLLIPLIAVNTKAASPDLVPTDIDFSPLDGWVGTPVNVTVSVENEGNQCTYDPVDVEITVESPDNGDIISTETKTISPYIQPGFTESITFESLFAPDEYGSYTVEAYIHPDDSETDTFDNTITEQYDVQSPDNPPTVSIEVNPDSVKVGKTITLHAEATDELGLTYLYAYFKGNWHAYGCGESTTCDNTWTFSESVPGTHTYKVKAKDTSNQESDEVKETIMVEEISHDLAIMSSSIPSLAKTGESVTFSASIENIGGASELSVVRFDVDGTRICSKSFSISTDSSITKTCTWTAVEGSHNVVISVDRVTGETDTSDNQVEGSINVETPTQSPVSDPNGPYSGYVDQLISFNGCNSYDPDGGNIVSYNWDFGDGTAGVGSEPKHSYSSAGVYTAKLTVVDDDGEMDTSQTTVSIKYNESIDFDTPSKCDINIKDFEYTPHLAKEGEVITFVNTLENLGKKTSIDLVLEVEDEQKDIKRITLNNGESKEVELQWKAEKGVSEVVIRAESDCDDEEEIELDLDIFSDCFSTNVLVQDHEGGVVEDAEVTIVGGKYKQNRESDDEGVAKFCVPEGDYVVYVESDGRIESVTTDVDEPTLVEVDLPKEVLSKSCKFDIELSGPTFAFTGEDRSATLEIENEGPIADNYLITVSGESSHWITPLVKEISIKEGKTKEVFFNYYIPSNAREGYHYLNFDIESALCGSIESESLRTRVVTRKERTEFVEEPEIEFEIIDAKLDLVKGEEKSWPIYLKNEEETIQKIEISLMGLPNKWAEYEDDIYLDPQRGRNIYINLSIPRDATLGVYQGELEVSYDDYSMSEKVSFTVKEKEGIQRFKFEFPKIGSLSLIYLAVLVLILLVLYGLYRIRQPEPLKQTRTPAPVSLNPVSLKDREESLKERENFKYVNKKGESYWLHKRNGRYFFSKKEEDSVPKPEEYSVVETRSGLPVLKKES